MKKVISVIVLVLSVVTTDYFAQDSTKLKAFYESISAEKIGNYDDAISALVKSYDKEKNDYFYNLRLGWLYYLKGDFKTSVFYYNNAIRISNKSIESLIGITYPYSKLNKTDKLKDVYREILKKEPGNYTANLNLGLLFYYEGDYLNAIVFLEKVEEDYPSDYSANLYLGWANYYVGATKKAKTYFENALIVAPNDPSARKGFKACQ